MYVVLQDVLSNFLEKKSKLDSRRIYAKPGEVCKIISISGNTCICEKYVKSGTTYKSTGERFPVSKNKIREV